MKFLGTAWCWLNDNSAGVAAIATVFIAWASCMSAGLVRQGRNKERTDRMPVLTFIDELVPAANPKESYRSLYIKNAGYGPALNIVRKVIDGGTLLSSTNEVLNVGALAPTEKAFAYLSTPPGRTGVPVLDQPSFYALVECDDIRNVHYEFTYRDRMHSKPKMLRKRKMPPNEAQRI
jgi:hypothetical protein